VPFDSLVKSSVCYIFCLVHSSAWYFFRHSPLAGAFFCFTPLSGAIFLYTPLAGVILHGSFLFLVHSSVWNIFWCTPLSEAFLTMEYCVWCIFVWCIYFYLLSLSGVSKCLCLVPFLFVIFKVHLDFTFVSTLCYQAINKLQSLVRCECGPLRERKATLVVSLLATL